MLPPLGAVLQLEPIREGRPGSVGSVIALLRPDPRIVVRPGFLVTEFKVPPARFEPFDQEKRDPLHQVGDAFSTNRVIARTILSR
jgi:hypothetical protein